MSSHHSLVLRTLSVHLMALKCMIFDKVTTEEMGIDMQAKMHKDNLFLCKSTL